MINYQYTIENQSGGSITINDHTTNPSQIIALQSYPQFDVNIKTSELDKEGQHGVWDFFSFYGRRVVTFEGVIVGNTEQDVETVKSNLLEVLRLPTQPDSDNEGSVTLKWKDANNDSWQITDCKIFRPPQFDRPLKQTFRLNFSFSLKSAFPFIVSQTLIKQTGTRGWIVTGGEFPLEMPSIIGINNSNVLTIDHDGSSSAQTVIRIYGEDQGDITNPEVKNLTTGKTFSLSSTISGSSNWIEIDSKNGTVVDQSGNDKSGDILGGSEFITLDPNLNDLLYLSDEDPEIELYDPKAPFSVSYRNTKI